VLVRQLLALVALSTSACLGFVACANETDDSSAEPPKEDDVVSERQLNGSDMPEKTISLTLDDGPGERTGELAEFLAAEGVKGTFFINGKNAVGAKGQAAVAKIMANGHILANHTHNHKQLTKLGSAEIAKEVADTDAIIAKAQPNGPWLIRAPFGAWNANVARGLNAGPMKKYVGSVFWDEGGDLTDRSAADWACWGAAKVSVERCGQLYVQETRAKKRGIILVHDIHSKTVDMLKQIVPQLKSEGFKFVGLDEAPSVARAIESSKGLSGAAGTGTESGDQQ
jgi:peptidoglycan/xylan/chitin deacetylase (PgdA/CDA1 family)